ncbi:MAG: hypothetical protein ACNA7K_05655 [Acholeplasmataceae bacterium]
MIDFFLSNIGVLLLPFVFFYVFFFSKHIHKYQYFYEAFAFLLAIFSIVQQQFGLNLYLINVFIISGHVSLSLFLLVIFTGALKKKSVIRSPLDMVRGEVAIMAFILLIPHGFYRIDLALSGYNTTGLIANILFVPLVLTSFVFVRSRMKPHHWRRLHQLSYVTYAMIYLHLAFIISINPNNPYIILSRYAIIYHLLLVLYVLLRFKNSMYPKIKQKRFINSISQ